MRQEYPSQEQFKESINLIASSVENEKSDAVFYEWLINNIPRHLNEQIRQNIKQTIEGIRADEQMHNRTFKAMYKQLTGSDVAPVPEEAFVPPVSFVDGIMKAIKGEMEAVKRYRKIIMGLPNNYYRDQVFNILTDELRHGILYNSIYTTVV